MVEQEIDDCVLSSEEQRSKAIRSAQEQTVYKTCLLDAIEKGRIDKEAGGVHADHKAFFNEVREGLGGKRGKRRKETSEKLW